MKIIIPYDFNNWNEYIDKERSNRYWANNIKQKEAKIVAQYATEQYQGKYPVKITVLKYFKDKRQDLDNVRIKGVLDGLVKHGVIKNDNLKHIQEIVLKAEINKEKIGIEIEIEEMSL